MSEPRAKFKNYAACQVRSVIQSIHHACSRRVAKWSPYTTHNSKPETKSNGML